METTLTLALLNSTLCAVLGAEAKPQLIIIFMLILGHSYNRKVKYFSQAQLICYFPEFRAVVLNLWVVTHFEDLTTVSQWSPRTIKKHNYLHYVS